ncbi:MAG: hypothetical protein EBR67_10370 [Proteobacteria bacterium]|nr:hypothetical protein [Pseudomonadota bacterium]
MRNRFGNREVLCEGVGFNPNVSGTGGVKQPPGINTANPLGLPALEAIRHTTGEATDRNNLSASGKLCTACHR